MESSSGASDNCSLETIEESFGHAEDDLVRADVASNGCTPEGSISLNMRKASNECVVGTNDSDLATGCTSDESLVAKPSGNSQWIPEIGMVFYSEGEAYAFYNTYAFRNGFSIRKGHLGRRRDGTIRDRVFLCSNEGSRQKHRTHNTKKPRAVVRTNCMARIEFKVNRDKLWLVNKVIYDHNHPLAPPNDTPLLRSHRKLFLTQDEETEEIDDFGLRSDQMHAISAEEAHDTDSILLLLKDQSSYLQTNRTRDLEKGVAQVLLDFLKGKQLEDPSFFYAIQLDVNEQATNFFWADARSIIDYSYFGDVVLFDTTYQMSKNDLPFAPFTGINHHKQLAVFGAALLLDETTESFVWLFKTFMIAMSGRQPKTMCTDQGTAISRAINIALPNTCHRLCLWHILQNVSEHISHSCSSETNFQTDFKCCMYEVEREEDFHAEWNNLISKYDLAGNSWFQELYENRDKWALVYHRNSFCATMTTTQWTESMKNNFKRCFNRKLPLPKFLEQYNKALIQFREKELYEDYQSRQTKPVLLVDMPMLNETADSYTRLIYMDFEDEFKGQLSCLCELVRRDGTVYTFKVSVPDKGRVVIVEFNPTNLTVNCSCKKFESMGILCMHSLKVLSNNNILHLPSQYLMKRWTKYANEGVVFDKYQSIVDCQEPMTVRYNRIFHKAITIGVKSAFSEDALKTFEHELNNLMAEVEYMLHNVPSNRPQEGITISEDIQQNILERIKKKQGQKVRLKDSVERKRKRKPQTDCNSDDMSILHAPRREANDSSVRVVINDSSNGQPYHQGGATTFCNSIAVQSCDVSGCTSFPPEVDLPAQEPFTHSQDIFDQTIASQTANDTNIAWARGSLGFPMPFMQGQLSWMVQPPNIVNVAMPQSHLAQQMHSGVPSRHPTLSCKVHFDINKGS